MRGDGLSRTVRRVLIRPHMRFDLSLQTMMSSQVRPPNSHFHHWGGSRTDPSFHDVIDPEAGIARPLENSFFRDRANLKTGGARRDRTDDLMLAKHALYQLSYGPSPERVTAAQ